MVNNLKKQLLLFSKTVQVLDFDLWCLGFLLTSMLFGFVPLCMIFIVIHQL